MDKVRNRNALVGSSSTSITTSHGQGMLYCIDAIQAPPSLPAASSSAVNLAAADDEKHLFTPNTKKSLTEIEGTREATTPDASKPAHPGISAKRSLDYAFCFHALFC